MDATRITIILIACVLSTAPSGGQTSTPTANLQTPAATSAATLEHAPSTLQVVASSNGELSIVAFNSTLREVLGMVRSKTGAKIDIPPGADERVFVELGPGPAHAVLDSLLEGSDFNYVIVWPEGDSRALTSVVLFPKLPVTTEESSSLETADLSSQTGPGTESVRYQEIVQAPPSPIQEKPEAAEALSKLALSLVHRASSHP